MKGLIWVVCPLLGGCGEILGTNQYSVTTESPSRDEDGGNLPVLPAQPDSSRRVACEACAERECSEFHEKCLDGQHCTDLLRCSNGCSDPNCLYGCIDTLPRSLDFEDYFSCVFGGLTATPILSQCIEECGVGQNWACVDDGFYWDRRDAPVTASVRLYDVTATGPLSSLSAGIEIAPCNDGLPSASVPPSGGDMRCDWTGQSTDKYGSAGVTLPASPEALTEMAIRGHDEAQRLYLRPMPQSGALELWLVRTPFIDFLVGGFFPGDNGCCGPPVDPTQGSLWFNVFDCLGQSAKAVVEISVPEFPARLLGTPPGEYGSYIPRPGSGNPADTAGTSGFFYNVPPSQVVTVTARHPDTGGLLSRRTVIVAEDWLTTVHLYPLSENE